MRYTRKRRVQKQKKQRGGADDCQLFLDEILQKSLQLKQAAIEIKEHIGVINVKGNHESFSHESVIEDMDDLIANIEEAKEEITRIQEVYRVTYDEMNGYYGDVKNDEDLDLDELMESFGRMGV